MDRDKIAIAVCGVAMVAAGIMFFRSKHRSTPSATQELGALSAQAHKTGDVQSPPSGKMDQASFDRQEALAAKVQTGMKSLALKEVKGELQIPVHIESVSTGAGCTVGDLDAIRVDQRRKGKGDLLLTVEPLGGADVKPLVLPLDIGSVSKGMDHVFSIPKRQGVLAMGVYLCRDGKGAGHCAGMSADKRGTQAALDEKMDELAGKKVPVPASRVYFFQMALVNDGELMAFDQPMRDPVAYDNVTKFVGGGKVSEGDKKMIEGARHLADTYGSRPLLGANSRVDISLPFLDTMHCKTSQFVKILAH